MASTSSAGSGAADLAAMLRSVERDDPERMRRSARGWRTASDRLTDLGEAARTAGTGLRDGWQGSAADAVTARVATLGAALEEAAQDAVANAAALEDAAGWVAWAQTEIRRLADGGAVDAEARRVASSAGSASDAGSDASTAYRDAREAVERAYAEAARTVLDQANRHYRELLPKVRDVTTPGRREPAGDGAATPDVSADTSGGSVPPPVGDLDAAHGSYRVDGLGARKREILAQGGTSFDLAVAMLESDRMTADYAYGDHKTGDAANFGVFKQNWAMIRTADGERAGGEWNAGAVLNADRGRDVEVMHESQEHYGRDRWLAGHRYGQGGLDDPGLPVVQEYRKAVTWIQAQIDADPATITDDTRFWVDVPAV